MKKIISFALMLILTTHYSYGFNDINAPKEKHEILEESKEIIIKGEIIFPEYEQGYIRIIAFKEPVLKQRTAITHVDIKKPGPYTLRLPVGTKKVYLVCYNDSNNDGPPVQPSDPATWYINPQEIGLLTISGNIMEDIDLILFYPPETGRIL